MVTYRDKILQLFHRDNRTYHGHEIARLCEIPKNSVHTPLSRMVKEGILIRPRPTLYEINPAVGIGNVVEPFRIQNVRLVADTMDGKAIKAPDWLKYRRNVGFIDELYFDGLGMVKKDRWGFRFQIGSKRGKLTMTITAPLGLTLYGWQISMWWRDETSRKYGFNGHVDWYVDRGTEWMKDVLGVDLDSMSKSMTLETYEGYVLKMYQKAYGTRGEIKLDKPTSVQAVMATLMGSPHGAYTMNAIAQGLGQMKDQTNLLRSWSASESQRGAGMDRLMPEFASALFKIIDKMDDVLKGQQGLEERMKKLEDK